MISTTLEMIRDAQPCADGWAQLLRGLGEGGDPDLARTVALREIVASNGVADALWAARHACDLTAEGERVLRLFASDVAERALRAEREAGREPDGALWAAVEAARAYARGEIGAEELRAAWAAARAAADARAAAVAAAWDAAAWAAVDAADVAAHTAACAAVANAAVANAADAVCAERDWQAARLLAYLRGEVTP